MSCIINIETLSFILKSTYKEDNPPTSNKFPSTEPVKEAKTTSVNPAWSAKIEMISSTALPKVAFNKPPIRNFRNNC